jgi:hypothetical protein
VLRKKHAVLSTQKPAFACTPPQHIRDEFQWLTEEIPIDFRLDSDARNFSASSDRG